MLWKNIFRKMGTFSWLKPFQNISKTTVSCKYRLKTNVYMELFLIIAADLSCFLFAIHLNIHSCLYGCVRVCVNVLMRLFFCCVVVFAEICFFLCLLQLMNPCLNCLLAWPCCSFRTVMGLFGKLLGKYLIFINCNSLLCPEQSC